MAFTYSAGLRIRAPDPMPDCMAGESPQDFFERVLTQCSLESATSAENASGDSAPTPFNVGEIQAGILDLETAVEGLGTNSGTQQLAIDALQENYVTGVGVYALGDTQTVVALPSEGTWRICGVVPLTQALASLFVNNLTLDTFIVNFGAAGAAGSFHWAAYKVA